MQGEYISIETLRIYQDIEKENKELHKIIDKAIEFIGNPLDNYWEQEAQYLLSILNGDIDE